MRIHVSQQRGTYGAAYGVPGIYAMSLTHWRIPHTVELTYVWETWYIRRVQHIISLKFMHPKMCDLDKFTFSLFSYVWETRYICRVQHIIFIKVHASRNVWFRHICLFFLFPFLKYIMELFADSFMVPLQYLWIEASSKYPLSQSSF